MTCAAESEVHIDRGANLVGWDQMHGDYFLLPMRLYTKANTLAPKVYVDLTGCTLHASLRRVYDGPLVAQYTTAIVTPQAPDDIGRFSLEMTSAVALLLPVVDLQWALIVVDSGGHPETRLKGTVHITPNPTLVSDG